ncbi:MAG: HPr(Ser) kinase/phosphatase [Velocimicrobium sp.]
MYTVEIQKLIDKLNLENLTPEIPLDDISISQTDVNRPALQLAGYFDYFDSNRIQVIGHVEASYLQTIGHEKEVEMMKRIMDHKVPCIAYCRSIEVNPEVIKMALEYKIPILRSTKTTSSFMAEVIRWLNVELAPRISIHGVLVDVFGEGLLIMGESGIGKSEAALELIKRGHRLVTDDVVEIKKVSDDTLIGTAPDITRHFIELRGIGIIDVKTLFGVESVKDTQCIDLVIKLEEWNKDEEYDRLGLEEKYTEFLGNKVVCHSIPIRPGRNLAIICESAAVNYRQKKMGYNAARELYNRVTNNLMNK